MFAAFRRWPALRRLGVVLFILPLMFAGGSLVGSLAGQSVGEVGSLEISRSEFAAVHQQIEEQYRRQYNVDNLPEQLAIAAIRQTQARLRENYLVRAAIADKNIRPPDSAIADEIRQIPDFQDKNGVFSITLFNDYVRDVRRLENQVRQNLRHRPLRNALQAYPVTAVRNKLAVYRRQQRVMEEVSIPITVTASINDEAVSRYYLQHQNEYHVPEKSNWEYIVVTVNAYATAQPPTAENITLAFEELLDERSANEQRRARHIFIEGEGAKARTRAANLAEQARAAPDSFTELAREFSEDAGSAFDGGDLGAVVRGDLPDTMDAALFLMAPGEISQPLAVEGGFSVLQMVSSSAPPPSLAEVKDEVMARAQLLVARDDFLDAVEHLQELAQENPGSLATVAAVAGVSIQTATAVGLLIGDNPPPFNNPQVLQQLRVAEVLNNGETSAAISMDDNDNAYILARATDYQAGRIRPPAEVQAEIIYLLQAQQQVKLMEEHARSNNGMPPLPTTLSWRGPLTLSLTDRTDALEKIREAALTQIFMADLTHGLPAFSMVADSTGVRVFRITEVANLPPQSEDADVIDTLLDRHLESAGNNAYLESLAEVYEVHFDLPKQ